MIKARVVVEGRAMLVLGLSAENRKRLGRDMPIRISTADMEELGFTADFDVVILGGETEGSILTDIRRGYGSRGNGPKP